MIKIILLSLLIVFSFQLHAVEENDFIKFTKLLAGESAKQDEKYEQMLLKYGHDFKQNLVDPVALFTKNNLSSVGKSLFYPFAGPDISNPLLLFPDIEQYVLVGMEFPGHPEIVHKKFQLAEFQPQVEGFLRVGFFKTMDMSAQMYHDQGIIPILVAQIGLLGGMVENIVMNSHPFNGIIVDFVHNNKPKKLYYYRTNLNDNNDKAKFFEFMLKNNLLDNCMLKASSYKLHQTEFKQLRQFMSDNCPNIIQDDTGIPVRYLQAQKREIQLFGNYVHPYGDEFKPYYQKELATLYEKTDNKIKLDFCYGYGCKKIEANLLIAKKSLQ